MGIAPLVRQYWPLSVVTVAIVSGFPFITSSGGHRPGLNGITGRAGGLSTEDDLSVADDASKTQAGYARPSGMLPLYGFEGINLQAPIFPSWWDGKTAGAKLKDLDANTIALGQVWRDTRNFHDTMARLHGAGLKVMVDVAEPGDWIDLREDANGRLQPVPNTFVVGRALHVLAEARKQGAGRFADFVVIGGEPMRYATQLQRRKMYQVAKQYFPTTPLVVRYGSELELAEATRGKLHPMGSTWEEYRFGQDECDIALVTIDRVLGEGRLGLRVSAALEQLNQIVSVVKSRHPEAAIVVRTQVGEEREGVAGKALMWAPKEIDQFVSAILTSAGIDGLLFHGLGNYPYDFAHPDFEAQRVALKQAAPTLSPMQDIAPDRAPASVRQ